ncbi:MAG: hypothetical protein AAFY56_16475 [Pseudomonadota bacterium]
MNAMDYSEAYDHVDAVSRPQNNSVGAMGVRRWERLPARQSVARPRAKMRSVRRLFSTIAITLTFGIWMAPAPATAAAKTPRTAYVVVKNETGLDLAAVSVKQKYSNVYNNDLIWPGVLKDGETTSPKAVNYNTGWATTGKSWWAAQWTPVDDPIVFHTRPANFRQQIDFMTRNIVPGLIGAVPALAGVACTGVTGGACAPLALGAVKATTVVSVYLIEAGMKGGDTAGLKQHILRPSDAGKTVTITLHRTEVDGTPWRVSISSPSGTSRTQFSGHYPDLDDKDELRLQAAIDADIASKGLVQDHSGALAQREARCFRLVQGHVAWKARGSRDWDPVNVKRLCSGVTNTFDRLACFNNRINADVGWSEAINRCDHK